MELRHCLTGLVLVLGLSSVVLGDNKTCTVPNPKKQDCGYVGINQQGCEAKGCCWVPEGTGSTIPWCFFKEPPSPPPPPPPPTPPPPPPGQPPFSDSEMQKIRGYFMANIDIKGSGAVVASPDPNTPGGSYYYHWSRDGALTMQALQITSGSMSDYEKQMKDYTQWVVARHAEADPNNVDIRIEVKYEIPSGDVFTGGWCRPQTDGPGLRSIALITFANTLIKNGQSDFVKSYLWTGDSSQNQGGAIKFDLDWVAGNWSSSGCDLWEEVQSDDFFWNRYTMRRALTMGAAFATSMGDSSTAATYTKAAQSINTTLARHYNGNFVFESDNRQQDASVICAFNNGYMQDSVFAPGSVQVANTVKTLSELFHTTFTINQVDDKSGIPGILYGRYQGDSYAGGNPWVLTSGCLAELMYRAAGQVLGVSNDYVSNDVDRAAWAAALRAHGLDVDDNASKEELAKLMATSGDGVLFRIRHHVAPDGFHMAEQIDRNTGKQTSATDLTWSYATVLKAMTVRNATMQAFSNN